MARDRCRGTPARNACNRVLAVGVAAACSAAGATGGAPASMVARLAHSGEVSCRPALPHFCANLHVACAGRSSIAALPFTLKAQGVRGTVESAAEPDPVLVPYQNGRIEWDRDGAYAILFPPQGSGYIKLLSDGSYSFRHYAPHGAVMSIGRCS